MDQVFTAASHHDILMLLIQVAILLFTARILGEVAQRLGQPTVVGEILAGIVLGPSLLSGIFPALGEWIIPQNPTQGALLELIGLLGVMFLLLITGLETDLVLIRRQARSALGVAAGGLILPLVLGFVLAQFLPGDLLVDPDNRLVFALFLAIAMAISAIPVVAKVLMDLELTRRNIGQTIIAAAMIDDTIGWILLSIVIGLASTGVVTLTNIASSALTVAAFMVLSLTVGQWLMRRALGFVQDKIQGRDKVLSFIVLLMFIWGAIGQALGIEALLGAFVIGIVFSLMPRLNVGVIHQLESITLGIFAPIFFAVAGLKVNAVSLLEPRLLGITLLVIGVAVLCKMLGVYVGSRWIGKSDHWTAIFFGAGLNARGSIGIIVANIGLSLSIINQDMFSIIVMMAIVTSVMSPFILRWAVAHITPEQEELARLEQERIKKSSLVANIQRVLLPIRLRETVSPLQSIEAQLLSRLSVKSPNLSLTLLTINGNDGERNGTSEFLDKVAALFSLKSISKKSLSGTQPADLILNEAQNDYDLVVVGATEGRAKAEVLFTPVVDHVIRYSPKPTMLVQGRELPEDWAPRRILVPSNGSLASHRAAELGFALATDPTDEVIILQVVEDNPTPQHLDSSGVLQERQRIVAYSNVESLQKLGQMQNVIVSTSVQVGGEPESVILETAKRQQIDLIILGTNVGIDSNRLYLGPRVERILTNAPCPVVVLNA